MFGGGGSARSNATLHDLYDSNDRVCKNTVRWPGRGRYGPALPRPTGRCCASCSSSRTGLPGTIPSAGGTQNSYGELGQFVLPNSKIVIYFTTKYFGKENAASARLQPDISAPRTLADDLAGRNSALEAAIAAPLTL